MQEGLSKEKHGFNGATLTLVGVVLFIIAIVLIIWFLLQGQFTTTGEHLENSASKSLSCIKNGANYPFFTDDSFISATTKVNTVFDNNDSLQVITLIQAMSYDSAEIASKAISLQHADMNISFGKSGLEADAFSATYTTKDSTTQMTLYSTTSIFDADNAKYFMISGVNRNTSMREIETKYKEQGFTCEVNN